jgi:hypothetical protein
MEDSRLTGFSDRTSGYSDRTNGLVLLILVLAGLLGSAFVVRPKRPSPFAAGSGYGVGYGSGSIMVTGGASSSS